SRGPKRAARTTGSEDAGLPPPPGGGAPAARGGRPAGPGTSLPARRPRSAETASGTDASATVPASRNSGAELWRWDPLGCRLHHREDSPHQWACSDP
ncbi:unnamed protein product, partial [Rangifer tarandus platyrhynchus]